MSEWADIDPWLAKLRREHWTLYFFGHDQSNLTAIGAVLRHETGADVIILRGYDRAAAYRVPIHPNCDVFWPESVLWWYADNHSAVWVLRAALALNPPGQYPNTAPLYAAPPSCRIPLNERQPVTIRPT